MDRGREEEQKKDVAAEDTTQRVTLAIEERESFESGFAQGYRCAVREIIWSTCAALVVFMVIDRVWRD